MGQRNPAPVDGKHPMTYVEKASKLGGAGFPNHPQGYHGNMLWNRNGNIMEILMNHEIHD